MAALTPPLRIDIKDPHSHFLFGLTLVWKKLVFMKRLSDPGGEEMGIAGNRTRGWERYNVFPGNVAEH